MPPTHVYVKRNPIHPYTYNNPDDLPYIQWKYVKLSVAYNMYTSNKSVGSVQKNTSMKTGVKK